MTPAVRLGVLTAAGQGVRAYPRTAYTPKVLLEAGGKPLLLRNLEILRDQLGITDIIVLVGYMADQVRATLGDGQGHGVTIRYLDVGDVSRGLAWGLRQAKPFLTEPFVMILGDELYLGANHERLLRPPNPGRRFARSSGLKTRTAYGRTTRSRSKTA